MKNTARAVKFLYMFRKISTKMLSEQLAIGLTKAKSVLYSVVQQ